MYVSLYYSRFDHSTMTWCDVSTKMSVVKRSIFIMYTAYHFFILHEEKGQIFLLSARPNWVHGHSVIIADDLY